MTSAAFAARAELVDHVPSRRFEFVGWSFQVPNMESSPSEGVAPVLPGARARSLGLTGVGSERQNRHRRGISVRRGTSRCRDVPGSVWWCSPRVRPVDHLWGVRYAAGGGPSLEFDDGLPAREPIFDIQLVGASAGPLALFTGVTIVTQAAAADIPKTDIVFVPNVMLSDGDSIRAFDPAC